MEMSVLERDYLFTSESVTEGHPDKICDQISDAVLDAIISEGKLWPKLLKANAIEAIAELQRDNFKPASAETVKGFLAGAEKPKPSDKDVSPRVNLLTREDDENILFETRDRAEKGAWVHRNYIKKN